jgi:ABC-type Fe3+-hydroxamate transport system substrate-binding protein
MAVEKGPGSSYFPQYRNQVDLGPLLSCAELPILAPTVTVEAVIAANPEAIIASGMGDSRPEWLDDWRRWKTMKAVARGPVFLFSRQAVRGCAYRVYIATRNFVARCIPCHPFPD